MARTTDNASASATSANSSITNVAALANVSIATVSRVLSGKRTKDDDIARRVRAAAAHLNYSVNYAASALRSTVTNTIGLVIPTATDPFCAQLLDEIEPVIDVDSQQLLLGIGGVAVLQQRRAVGIANRAERHYRLAGKSFGMVDGESELGSAAMGIANLQLLRGLRHSLA